MNQYSKVGLFLLASLGGWVAWEYWDWTTPKEIKKSLIEVADVNGECWEQPEGQFRAEYGGSLVWWETIKQVRGIKVKKVRRYGSVGHITVGQKIERQHQNPAEWVRFWDISEDVWKKERWEINGTGSRHFTGHNPETLEVQTIEYEVPISCELFVEGRSPCFKAPGSGEFECKTDKPPGASPS